MMAPQIQWRGRDVQAKSGSWQLRRALGAITQPYGETIERREIAMKNLLMVTALVAAIAFGALAQDAEPKVKVLSTPEDATQKTVLLGRNFTASVIVTFELEPAKSMWLQTGNPPKWRERTVRKGEIYHLDVKPVDPKSKVVISYAEVRFNGVNRNA